MKKTIIALATLSLAVIGAPATAASTAHTGLTTNSFQISHQINAETVELGKRSSRSFRGSRHGKFRSKGHFRGSRFAHRGGFKKSFRKKSRFRAHHHDFYAHDPYFHDRKFHKRSFHKKRFTKRKFSRFRY